MRIPASAAAVPASESAYIESRTKNPFSCSFVEFDGRGDFVDFRQHVDCWTKIRDLAEQKPVLLVTYCHGWKNNSQSNDVVKFNDFLSRLASSEEGAGYRVHGVYLGWRGNSLKPFVAKGKGSAYEDVGRLFGEPIVSSKWHRKSKSLVSLPEQLTYWSRKRAAEHSVAGLPITRAIYTYAGTARNAPKTGRGGSDRNRVFVIGHSFGALMLEQSLLQGMVGGIMTEWSQGDRKLSGRDLPFDLVLLVNSAAPSIYAKQMREFLAADSSRRRRDGAKDADAPVVISITSTADKATGVAHRMGNLLSPLSPSMQRDYTRDLLKETNPDGSHAPVHQSEFYKRTPGHNPFLVNRWIVGGSSPSPAVPSDAAFGSNLDFSTGDPEAFLTYGEGGTAEAWRIADTNPGGTAWSFRGKTPDPWETSYWFVQCDERLIKDHGDVWSRKAMDVYAALYRIAAMKRAE